MILLTANATTLPILADASPALIDAIRQMLDGANVFTAGKALNRADRRNLLILRDHLTTLAC